LFALVDIGFDHDTHDVGSGSSRAELFCLLVSCLSGYNSASFDLRYPVQQRFDVGTAWRSFHASSRSRQVSFR
jgi:hypothetical protein